MAQQSAPYDEKDTNRIVALVERAGSEDAALLKAKQMANAIHDAAKARRRAAAAENFGYWDMAALFLNRARQLDEAVALATAKV